MSYELKKANESDISKLIDYELKTILEYADKLSENETSQINDYVKKSGDNQIRKIQNHM